MKAQPQKDMKPPMVTRFRALRKRKPAYARRYPAVCPMALHVAASSLLRSESAVSARPSTAMSCVAASR